MNSLVKIYEFEQKHGISTENNDARRNFIFVFFLLVFKKIQNLNLYFARDLAIRSVALKTQSVIKIVEVTIHLTFFHAL